MQTIGAALLVAGLLAACTSVPTPASPTAGESAASTARPAPTMTAGTPTPSVEPSAVTDSPASYYVGAVAFWDAQRGIVGAATDHADGTASGQILETHDGGHTWAIVLSVPDLVAEVWVAGTQSAWALTGCNGDPACAPRLYHTADRGATWTSASTDLMWVAFTDASSGWGVAGSGATTAPSQALLRSTRDAGATWQSRPSPCAGSPAGPLRAVAFRSASAGLAVCALTFGAGGENHAMLATRDGGATWAVRAMAADPPATEVGHLPYGGYISGLVLATDGTAWITGGRMVPLVSRDDGATWQPLGLGDPAANLVYAAWPLDARRGFAVMWAPDRQATLLEVTADGGRTWISGTAWPVGGAAPSTP
jgi:photosystem II stability/assembly factor-like uncharacterized protein